MCIVLYDSNLGKLQRIVFKPFLRPKYYYCALSEPNYFSQSASGYLVVLVRIAKARISNETKLRDEKQPLLFC